MSDYVGRSITVRSAVGCTVVAGVDWSADRLTMRFGAQDAGMFDVGRRYRIESVSADGRPTFMMIG